MMARIPSFDETNVAQPLGVPQASGGGHTALDFSRLQSVVGGVLQGRVEEVDRQAMEDVAQRALQMQLAEGPRSVAQVDSKLAKRYQRLWRKTALNVHQLQVEADFNSASAEALRRHADDPDTYYATMSEYIQSLAGGLQETDVEAAAASELALSIKVDAAYQKLLDRQFTQYKSTQQVEAVEGVSQKVNAFAQEIFESGNAADYELLLDEVLWDINKIEGVLGRDASYKIRNEAKSVLATNFARGKVNRQIDAGDLVGARAFIDNLHTYFDTPDQAHTLKNELSRLLASSQADYSQHVSLAMERLSNAVASVSSGYAYPQERFDSLLREFEHFRSTGALTPLQEYKVAQNILAFHATQVINSAVGGASLSDLYHVVDELNKIDVEALHPAVRDRLLSGVQGAIDNAMEARAAGDLLSASPLDIRILTNAQTSEEAQMAAQQFAQRRHEVAALFGVPPESLPFIGKDDKQTVQKEYEKLLQDGRPVEAQRLINNFLVVSTGARENPHLGEVIYALRGMGTTGAAAVLAHALGLEGAAFESAQVAALSVLGGSYSTEAMVARVDTDWTPKFHNLKLVGFSELIEAYSMGDPLMRDDLMSAVSGLLKHFSYETGSVSAGLKATKDFLEPLGKGFETLDNGTVLPRHVLGETFRERSRAKRALNNILSNLPEYFDVEPHQTLTLGSMLRPVFFPGGEVGFLHMPSESLMPDRDGAPFLLSSEDWTKKVSSTRSSVMPWLGTRTWEEAKLIGSAVGNAFDKSYDTFTNVNEYRATKALAHVFGKEHLYAGRAIVTAAKLMDPKDLGGRVGNWLVSGDAVEWFESAYPTQADRDRLTKALRAAAFTSPSVLVDLSNIDPYNVDHNRIIGLSYWAHLAKKHSNLEAQAVEYFLGGDNYAAYTSVYGTNWEHLPPEALSFLAHVTQAPSDLLSLLQEKATRGSKDLQVGESLQELVERSAFADLRDKPKLTEDLEFLDWLRLRLE